MLLDSHDRILLSGTVRLSALVMLVIVRILPILSGWETMIIEPQAEKRVLLSSRAQLRKGHLKAGYRPSLCKVAFTSVAVTL